MNKPGAGGVDRQNPAWTADTEALATCLWRLIQIYKHGQTPAIRPPASDFCAPASGPIAPEAVAE